MCVYVCARYRGCVSGFPSLHTAGWQWTWPKASSAGGSERMQIYLGAVADLQMNLQRSSLSLGLSLSLPGSMPHMGPCRNFSFWNIGKAFNVQIDTFSLRPVVFSVRRKSSWKEWKVLKLVTSLHNNEQNLLSNKLRDINNMVWIILVNLTMDANSKRNDFCLSKKRISPRLSRIYFQRWPLLDLRSYLKFQGDKCIYLFAERFRNKL